MCFRLAQGRKKGEAQTQSGSEESPVLFRRMVLIARLFSPVCVFDRFCSPIFVFAGSLFALPALSLKAAGRKSLAAGSPEYFQYLASGLSPKRPALSPKRLGETKNRPGENNTRR